MVHLERVRYAQLVPIAGPVRKPKYVESPRVPGEAALPLRKGSEPGEPSANGECLLSCPATSASLLPHTCALTSYGMRNSILYWEKCFARRRCLLLYLHYL